MSEFKDGSQNKRRGRTKRVSKDAIPLLENIAQNTKETKEAMEKMNEAAREIKEHTQDIKGHTGDIKDDTKTISGHTAEVKNHTEDIGNNTKTMGAHIVEIKENTKQKWYERTGAILGLIAAACAILGLSVFGVINYFARENEPSWPAGNLGTIAPEVTHVWQSPAPYQTPAETPWETPYETPAETPVQTPGEPDYGFFPSVEYATVRQNENVDLYAKTEFTAAKISVSTVAPSGETFSVDLIETQRNNWSKKVEFTELGDFSLLFEAEAADGTVVSRTLDILVIPSEIDGLLDGLNADMIEDILGVLLP